MDCSSGTCDGCGGVFGFDYDSAVVGTAESGGTVSLTLVRLVGTDGEVTVDLDVTGGNATEVSDFGGTWPIQVQGGCPPVRMQEAGREGSFFCRCRRCDVLSGLATWRYVGTARVGNAWEIEHIM